MGTSPAIHLWTVRQRNDVAITLPLEVFTQRNSVADFLRQKLKFTGKQITISRFVSPFVNIKNLRMTLPKGGGASVVPVPKSATGDTQTRDDGY